MITASGVVGNGTSLAFKTSSSIGSTKAGNKNHNGMNMGLGMSKTIIGS
jgi:hypothetical protein